MIKTSIAAIVLAFCLSAVSAQKPAEATLTAVVTDQTNAVIPGAHVTVTGQENNTRVSAIADASGKAVLHLSRGSYALKVQAGGFAAWKEKNLEVKAETQRTVILHVDVCGPCIDVIAESEIPLEQPVLAAGIPLIPMLQFTPPARPIRHKKHLFKASRDPRGV